MTTSAPQFLAHLLIGSDPRRCHLVAAHRNVSGVHAAIHVDAQGGTWIEDLGSTNGTWRDGVRLQAHSPDPLAPGTRLGLGLHVSVVIAEQYLSPLRTPAAAEAAGRALPLGRPVYLLEPGTAPPVPERPTPPPLAPMAPTSPAGHPSTLPASDAARAEPEVVPLEANQEIYLGRRDDCDIVLSAPSVSGRHARLRVLPDRSGYSIQDLGSTNGTYIGNRAVRLEGTVEVTPGDVVFLGSYRLPIARVPDLLADSGVEEGVGQDLFIIGRDPTNVDVHIDAPVVSARHASVEILPNGQFRIRDLGSSNGTYVNGIQVRGETIAEVSDRLSLGSYEVRLDPHRGVTTREYHGDIMLQAERVSWEVRDPRAPGKRKQILHDISFTAYPTEIVGLMGPSGAGKTTLMMALGGLLPPTEGRAVLNGLDVYESYNAFRGNIGYVPQDDIVYPQLTVYESLYYTARLRLPADTTHAEIDDKITTVLADLEISHTRHTRIGDALEKGISGGERKRVNVAQELITDPSLLFLDEPTSGLASEDALNVMRLLRSLADTGKTILLTIHQPSLESYRLMDNVLYLVRGNTVYYGPAFPDSILHFNRDTPPGPARDQLLADPGNAMKPLVHAQRAALSNGGEEALVQTVTDARSHYERSGYYREYVQERARGADDVEVRPAGVQKVKRRGSLRQLRWLTGRVARIKGRDRVNTAILIAQAPIIALILALVFGGEGLGTFEMLRQGPASLFLLVASAVWFGCSNAAREIVAELPIFRRERMVNLTLPSYVFSKVLVLGGVCALQCLVLLALTVSPLNLQGSFLTHYVVLLLSSLVGLGMGLTLSALVRSQQAAVTLVPLMLIPQIILGGVIMPVHKMGPVTRSLAAMTATRWGVEAALHAEFDREDLGAIQARCEIPACVWGAGVTGAAFTYYPGDPEATTEVSISAGTEALKGGIVPYSEPVGEPLCQVFCPSVRDGKEISPLDQVFGPDPNDAVRQQAWQDIAVEGHAPDLVEAQVVTARTSLATSLSVLGGMFFVFVGLVLALLRARDVESG